MRHIEKLTIYVKAWNEVNIKDEVREILILASRKTLLIEVLQSLSLW